jgi:acetylornithine deacetylase/succinyl-diaminopimelate desuccinylase-like protein
MMKLERVLARVDGQFGAAVSRYIDFLRIPSISTDPAYQDEVKRAGEWLCGQFREIGFTVNLHGTKGHPVVLAHYEAEDAGAPHILYYGHYDVQPPEPLELWKSPPFEPVIVKGPHGKRVVARGAADDKGQVMTFLEAFRAWKSVHGSLPVTITALIEGEEESGSASLPGFLAKHAASLRKAAVAVICDTNAWDIDTPAIICRLRGNVYVEVTVEGPSHDLHSGLYGGAAVNPLNVLTEMLGRLHGGEGRVQVPGFYDDVVELSPEERRAWERLPFDKAGFLGEAGLAHSVGEIGYTTLERLWARPTCDLHGIWGGYMGPGSKTVIASRASAKLSFRTVPDQQPAKILKGLRKFLNESLPPDCRLTIEEMSASAGILVPADGPFMRAAHDGLADIYKKPPAMAGCGGSIPVVGHLKDKLGLDSILAGFGLSDDRIHSPNEKFELKCLKNGIQSQAAMLARFAELSGPAKPATKRQRAAAKAT